jgi:hypothetical protein
MKVASSLDTTSMLLTATVARIQGLSVFIRALLLEHPPRGRMTNPQTNKSIAKLIKDLIMKEPQTLT